MIVFGESILIWWLFSFFSLILLIVVILHYIDAQRIWILTANSHLSVEKGIQMGAYLGSWYKQLSGIPEENKYRILLYIRLTMKNLIGREHSINSQ